MKSEERINMMGADLPTPTNPERDLIADLMATHYAQTGHFIVPGLDVQQQLIILREEGFDRVAARAGDDLHEKVWECAQTIVRACEPRSHKHIARSNESEGGQGDEDPQWARPTRDEPQEEIQLPEAEAELDLV